jgi:hypothetical protein
MGLQVIKIGGIFKKIMIFVRYPLGITRKKLKTRGVSHCGLAIYIKKYLKAKQLLWKLKYFTMQKYNLPKIFFKKPKSFNIL